MMKTLLFKITMASLSAMVLVFAVFGITLVSAIGAVPNSAADMVDRQGDSFNTNDANEGGISADSLNSTNNAAAFDIVSSPITINRPINQADPTTGMLFGMVGQNLVSVNPVTGQATVVASLPHDNEYMGYAVGASAYDAVNHLYFLPMSGFGNDYSESRLAVVNTLTGAVSTDVPLAHIPANLHYDSSNNILLGMVGQNLVSVNTATGQETIVASLPHDNEYMGFSIGASAYDAVNYLYFLPMSGFGNDYSESRLVVVNTLTGAVSTDVPLAHIPANLQYDTSSNAMLGIVGQNLVSVNPVTGQATVVASLPHDNEYMGYAVGASAYDAVNHLYFLPMGGFGNDYSESRLAVVNTLIGAVSTDVPLSHTPANLQYGTTPTNTGTISGVVYETDGVTPIANIYVSASGGVYFASACTDGAGKYTLSGLPLGVPLEIEASPSWANCGQWNNYVQEFWPEASSPQNAILLTLEELNPGRTDINFTLAVGGVISGTVYAADGTTLLQHIAIAFQDENGNYTQGVCADNGHYEFHGVPFDIPLLVWANAYQESWCDAGASYIQEYWQEASDAASATLLTVTALAPVQDGIDFTLDPGGSISGTVYETDGLTPITNIYIAASGSGGYFFRACTDSSGQYTLSNIPLGIQLKIEASPPWGNCGEWNNYVDEFWPDTHDPKKAGWVTLDAQNPDRIDINFTLDAGGVISGRVYEADGVTPIPHMAIVLQDDYRNFSLDVCADASGAYALHGVPFDLPLRVLTNNWCNSGGDYVMEYWHESPNAVGATMVSVTALAPSLTDIDFTLDPAGSISGTVYTADGVTPIPNLSVSFVAKNARIGASTDNLGHYTIHDVPFGLVGYAFSDFCDWCGGPQDYVPEFWPESLNLANATPLTTSQQISDLTGIDFTLEPGTASNANLDVWYLDGSVEAIDWPSGAHLTLEIDDTITAAAPDYTGETDVVGGDGLFSVNNQFKMKPGMIVVVSGGGVTKIAIIPPLTISNVDMALDTVTGTAGSNAWLWMYFDKSCCRSTVANGKGDWMIDYSVPGPNGDPIADISPGSCGAIHAPSGDGKTSVMWYASLPTVTSITRVSPNPTSKKSIAFTVTFSQSVTGVDKTDFVLSTTGAISGAMLTSVVGTGKVYTVTVATGNGDGTIRLDVLNDGSIQDDCPSSLTAPYTSGEIYTVQKSLTFTSQTANDGWILESSEISNLGSAFNSTATTIRLGDDATKKQYLGILSFSTGSGLPDNAVITKITLKVKRQGVVGGGNPLTTFQGFMVDIKKGVFGTAALQPSDFQTAASKAYGPFKPALASGWYSIDLTNGSAYINKASTASGLTQIRLRFKLDDNNNAVANYLSLFSGNASKASRPQLIIEYYVP